MNDELLNILSNSNKDIDNQKLMNYISKNLSDADRHEVEKQMMDSEFLNDAVEGLTHIENEARVNELTGKINSDFRKHLNKKKFKHNGKVLMPPSVLYVTIALILLLAIIGYLLIRKHMGM